MSKAMNLKLGLKRQLDKIVRDNRVRVERGMAMENMMETRALLIRMSLEQQELNAQMGIKYDA